MGARGPKKKLQKLDDLEGNPGKRGRKKMIPIVSATGEPFVPDHLSDDAEAAVELIKRLMPPGIYGAVDGFALAAYGTAYGWHKRAVHEMNHPQFEPLCVGASGQLVPNPWFKIKEQQDRLMMSWGDRLGLDPKSRQALHIIGADEKPKSKFDGLIGRDGGSPKRAN